MKETGGVTSARDRSTAAPDRSGTLRRVATSVAAAVLITVGICTPVAIEAARSTPAAPTSPTRSTTPPAPGADRTEREATVMGATATRTPLRVIAAIAPRPM